MAVGGDVCKGVEHMADAVEVERCRCFTSIDAVIGKVYCIHIHDVGDIGH